MVTASISGKTGAVYYRPRIRGTTISFVNSNPDTILDSGNGFGEAGFTVGSDIVITGSTSNNKTVTIASITRGIITLIGGDSLTAEVAGDDVTILQTDEVQLLGFYNWTLPYTVEALEVTAFDSNGWREFIAALKGWSASAARYFQTGAIITAATISFANDNPDTINDSGNGLVAAGFLNGREIYVSGAANSGNNAKFTVDTVAVGALTLISTDAVMVEAESETITIVQPVITKPGQIFHVRFYLDTGGSSYIYGTCLINSRTLNVPVEGIVGDDLEFTGIGSLSASP